MKERYYVDLQSRAITQNLIDQEAGFAIFADEADLYQLRSKLDLMRTADHASFLRSHVPILRYSKDPENVKQTGRHPNCLFILVLYFLIICQLMIH